MLLRAGGTVARVQLRPLVAVPLPGVLQLGGAAEAAK